jgi:hypothetical protein
MAVLVMVVLGAITFVEILVVYVLPAEFVVVTGITTGTRVGDAVACILVMPLRRELMSASREATWAEYADGIAELNHAGMLVASRAE